MSRNNRNNFDSIQRNAQKLSDDASQANTDAAVGVSDNAPVDTSTVTDDTATGSAVNVSTVKEPVATATAVYADQSDTVKLIVAHLEDYVVKADPQKAQTASSLFELQGMLVRTLEQLVNVPSNADFAICFRRLLTLVRENEDKAFASNMRFRKLSALGKGDAYLNRYIAFVDMVCAFAIPGNRASLIQRYNLARAAEFAKTEHRERLIEFIRQISQG